MLQGVVKKLFVRIQRTSLVIIRDKVLFCKIEKVIFIQPVMSCPNKWLFQFCNFFYSSLRRKFVCKPPRDRLVTSRERQLNPQQVQQEQQQVLQKK